MKKTILILVILSFIMCGEGEKTINKHHDHEKAAHSETHETEKDVHPKSIRVSGENQKLWGIQIDTAVIQNIASRVALPGVLALNKNRTAHISSFVKGQITQLLADLGDRVHKGKTLLTINSPEFAQAQADFLQARAKYKLSQKEFERAARLREKKAIEEKEYLRREAEHEKLTMEYAALGSKLHSFGITHDQIEKMIAKCAEFENEEYKCELADPHLSILSPLSGTIIARDVVIGDFIEPDKILFTVSNLDTLWAYLDAYEKDIPFIHKQSRIVIQSPLYPGRFFEGRISYISDTIDENLRTVKVRVEVDNKNRQLKPNMYIQGNIENESQDQKIIAIPQEAVQSYNEQKIIFKPEGENIFTVQAVQTGNKIGDLIIITSGLTKGDRFVLKGAFTLKTELSKATFGHVHVH